HTTSIDTECQPHSLHDSLPIYLGWVRPVKLTHDTSESMTIRWSSYSTTVFFAFPSLILFDGIRPAFIRSISTRSYPIRPTMVSYLAGYTTSPEYSSRLSYMPLHALRKVPANTTIYIILYIISIDFCLHNVVS